MKNTKHSTNPKKITKALSRKEMDQELALSLNQKRFWPISEERIMALAEDLKLMFEENPRMITLLDWRIKHDLYNQDVYNWRKKYPKFNNTINEVKERMGWRILQLSHREGDPAFAKYILPLYSSEFRKLEKWRSNLRKDTEGSSEKATINVIMSDYKESGKVPDKPIQEPKAQ